jgi:hypothetical protein
MRGSEAAARSARLHGDGEGHGRAHGVAALWESGAGVGVTGGWG